jgi:hypothetical protein
MPLDATMAGLTTSELHDKVEVLERRKSLCENWQLYRIQGTTSVVPGAAFLAAGFSRCRPDNQGPKGLGA